MEQRYRAVLAVVQDDWKVVEVARRRGGIAPERRRPDCLEGLGTADAPRRAGLGRRSPGDSARSDCHAARYRTTPRSNPDRLRAVPPTTIFPSAWRSSPLGPASGCDTSPTTVTAIPPSERPIQPTVRPIADDRPIESGEGPNAAGDEDSPIGLNGHVVGVMVSVHGGHHDATIAETGIARAVGSEPNEREIVFLRCSSAANCQDRPIRLDGDVGADVEAPEGHPGHTRVPERAVQIAGRRVAGHEDVRCIRAHHEDPPVWEEGQLRGESRDRIEDHAAGPEARIESTARLVPGQEIGADGQDLPVGLGRHTGGRSAARVHHQATVSKTLIGPPIWPKADQALADEPARQSATPDHDAAVRLQRTVISDAARRELADRATLTEGRIERALREVTRGGVPDILVSPARLTGVPDHQDSPVGLYEHVAPVVLLPLDVRDDDPAIPEGRIEIPWGCSRRGGPR
jgi:hypothetical protein